MEKTYGPPSDVLNEWNSPAMTREGALEALRFAVSEGDMMSTCVPMIAPLLSAALAYFEAETTSEIENLYRQWTDGIVYDGRNVTEEELEASHQVYQDLQETITAMAPTTARDMAISLFVETDGFGSLIRPEYNERVKRLINGAGWL